MTDLLEHGQKKNMHSPGNVRLIQVSNNRNDHKNRLRCPRRLIEVSVLYRYFFKANVGKEEWDKCCNAVRLINRGCPLNMGFA